MKQWKKPLAQTVTPFVLGSILVMAKGGILDEQTVEAASTTYTVTVSNLTVRSTPDTNGEVLGVVKEGESVSVVEKDSNGWYKINYDGRTGYVSGVYIKASTSTSTSTNTYTVTGNAVNVRSISDTSGTVLRTVNRGETVSVVEKESNGWYKISYNGQIGYVNGAYIEEDNGSSNASSFTSTASTYVAAVNILNVRDTPSADGKILGAITKGQSLSVVEKGSNGWYKINYNGQIGYVSGQYVQTAEATNSSYSPLYKKTIVLDAGHGGSDPGSIGSNYLYEKDVNLSVVQKLASLLEKEGAVVILTRSSDTFISLGQRVEIANASGADVFLSVHSNSSTSTLSSGIETHSYDESSGAKTGSIINKSNRLASSIQRAMVSELGSNDRGVEHGNYYVIRETMLVGVLAEIGFISNSEEASKLATDSYQDKVAYSLYNGLKNYFVD